MKIDGNGTTIHHNCTDGNSRTYGLHAYGASSSIHLASPLTIETISTNNGGGGNHGGDGTIDTYDWIHERIDLYSENLPIEVQNKKTSFNALKKKKIFKPLKKKKKKKKKKS